ncbi:flagellar hook assembly protein FlgD [Clostridium gasigenes]|nr:flagellar hook capping FlgD N-terminal domain-containing protein [Clostridium gasigenes]
MADINVNKKTMTDLTINNYTGERATEKGTKIMKPGQDMDKNAFLKILSAELSNMDPMGDNDSTKYVTQMAQFSSMEQMNNLNTTMTNYTAHDLAGKGVTMKAVDNEGKPYTGVVRAVTTTAGKTTISVEVNVNGKNEIKPFDIADVVTVLDVPDYTLPPITNMNGNMSFLVATAFIGKNVELSEKDKDEKNLKGTVLGVVKDDGVIKVRIKLEGTDEIKEFTYDKVIKVSEKGNEVPETPDTETPKEESV